MNIGDDKFHHGAAGRGVAPRMAAALALMIGLALIPMKGQAADIGNGSRIYNTHCLGCHGINGRAVMPDVPVLAMSDRLFKPDMMLLQRIKTGKNVCPPFIGILKDQEILDVISFLRTLR